MDDEKDEFYKAPCYYVMLHFSKVFVPGTRIISSSSPNKVLIGQRPNGDFVGLVQNLTPFESEYTFTKVINPLYQGYPDVLSGGHTDIEVIYLMTILNLTITGVTRKTGV